MSWLSVTDIICFQSIGPSSYLHSHVTSANAKFESRVVYAALAHEYSIACGLNSRPPPRYAILDEVMLHPLLISQTGFQSHCSNRAIARHGRFPLTKPTSTAVVFGRMTGYTIIPSCRIIGRLATDDQSPERETSVLSAKTATDIASGTIAGDICRRR